MTYLRTTANGLVTVLAVLALSPAGADLRVRSNVGLLLEYSDNATLVETNEQDDIIATGSFGIAVSENTGPVTGNLTANLRQQEYKDSVFGSETYFQLNAEGKWEPVRERIAVIVRDYYDQTPINSLAANVPSNIEDTNAFELSVPVKFPVADRHTLVVTPSFSDFSYSETPVDNQQTGIDIGWLYQFRPTVVIGLNAGYRDISYDVGVGDQERTTLQLVTDIRRARSRYEILAGVTRVERDAGSDEDGISGSFTWDHTFTPKSSFTAYISSNITNSSNAFLSSSTNPGTGTIGNVQVSDDVLRDNVARLTYNRRDALLGANIWFELRDLDYSNTLFDREVQEVGATVSYSFSGRTTGKLDAIYNRTEDTDISQTDKTSSLSGQVIYGLSARLSATVGVRVQKKDSTLVGNSYDEMAVFAGVDYRLTR